MANPTPLSEQTMATIAQVAKRLSGEPMDDSHQGNFYSLYTAVRELHALTVAQSERIAAQAAEIERLTNLLDYCAVCGQTVAEPKCTMADDEMNPCTWAPKCMARIAELESALDAERANADALAKELNEWAKTFGHIADKKVLDAHNALRGQGEKHE